MPNPGEREKHLGSGLLDDARKAITKRNKALREAMGEDRPGGHEEGTRRHSRRDGEDED